MPIIRKHLENCISTTERRIEVSKSEELRSQLEAELCQYMERTFDQLNKEFNNREWN